MPFVNPIGAASASTIATNLESAAAPAEGLMATMFGIGVVAAAEKAIVNVANNVADSVAPTPVAAQPAPVKAYAYNA